MRGSRLSGIFCVLASVLCPSRARCVPGTEWQTKGDGRVRDDEGANAYVTAYVNVSYFDESSGRFEVDGSEIGKYGDGRVGPAEGVLVHVSSAEGDHTGCSSPLRSSMGNGSLPKEPWIALIQRGRCSFEAKVENAYRHDAAAVLVYNHRDSPALDKMKLDSANVGTRNMSAVFTYKWKGEELARLADSGSRVTVRITVATRCTRSNSHANRTSVLFVSVSFVVLMLVSMAWLVFYYVQRFRYVHAKERLSKRLYSAAKKALSKIPTKEIRQEDSEVQGDGESCPVCIESYKVTDDLRILPCSHEFHKSCIDPWLLEHRTCPMCKMDILEHYGFVFGNGNESSSEAGAEVAGDDGGESGRVSERRTGLPRTPSQEDLAGRDPGDGVAVSSSICERCTRCSCKGGESPDSEPAAKSDGEGGAEATPPLGHPHRDPDRARLLPPAPCEPLSPAGCLRTRQPPPLLGAKGA